MWTGRRCTASTAPRTPQARSTPRPQRPRAPDGVAPATTVHSGEALVGAGGTGPGPARKQTSTTGVNRKAVGRGRAQRRRTMLLICPSPRTSVLLSFDTASVQCTHSLDMSSSHDALSESKLSMKSPAFASATDRPKGANGSGDTAQQARRAWCTSVGAPARRLPRTTALTSWGNLCPRQAHRSEERPSQPRACVPSPIHQPVPVIPVHHVPSACQGIQQVGYERVG